LWCQCESFGDLGDRAAICSGRWWRLRRRTPPRRCAQDILVEPRRPVDGNHAAGNTSCDMPATTSSGMIWSLEWRWTTTPTPSIAEATGVWQHIDEQLKDGSGSMQRRPASGRLAQERITVTIAELNDSEHGIETELANKDADVDRNNGCSRQKIRRAPRSGREMVSEVVHP